MYREAVADLDTHVGRQRSRGGRRGEVDLAESPLADETIQPIGPAALIAIEGREDRSGWDRRRLLTELRDESRHHGRNLQRSSRSAQGPPLMSERGRDPSCRFWVVSAVAPAATR